MANKKISRFRLRPNRMKCECGEEILVLPDVRATNDAIEAHIALHMKGVKGRACTTREAKRLRDSLIVQVLSIASRSQDL